MLDTTTTNKQKKKPQNKQTNKWKLKSKDDKECLLLEEFNI